MAAMIEEVETNIVYINEINDGAEEAVHSLADLVDKITANSIRELTLRALTSRQTHPLYEAMSRNSSIEHLEINCEINAIELAKALSANTGRRALTLKGRMIGMFDYEELAFNTIQHLYIWDITDGTMSKQRVDILVRAFANNDVLQTLLISKNHMSLGAVQRIVDMVAGKSSVQLLNFHACGLGDAGLGVIVNKLLTSTSLRVLSLRNNDITEAATSDIVNLITTNKSIEELLLHSNAIHQPESNKLILHALKNNSTLKRIGFDFRGPVLHSWIENCFETNTTIERLIGGTGPNLIGWYSKLNEVCNELKADKKLRDSAPQSLDWDHIEFFVSQMLKSSEEWRCAKLVVLGHGRIGKTTLLAKLRSVLSPNDQSMASIESTVGVDCKTISLANGEVMVWDFAGQLEYVTTHQFFLSKEMVVYFLCFDLSQPLSEQMAQASYWLDFLNSALPLPYGDSRYNENCHWCIMAVGLKSDLRATPSLQSQHLTAWLGKYSRLPIFPQLFVVSSMTSSESVQLLLQAASQECARLFSKHATMIPTTYRNLLRDIQHLAANEATISSETLFGRYPHGMTQQSFDTALRYFHSIGHIVLIKNDLVFTNPALAPQIASKFVSPAEVSANLLKEEGVQILDKHEIGWLLNVGDGSSNRIETELALMVELKICFELQSRDQKAPLYLFPSLSIEAAEFAFSLTLDNPVLLLSGIRFKVPQPDLIFVPGFYCQLMVEILTKLNVSNHS